MDKNNRTSKNLLSKGLKQMIICLFLLFIGPTMLHLSLSNKDKSFYVPLLIVSILICITAILFLFIGINTILNSIFKKK